MKNEIDFLALLTASAKRELQRQEVARNLADEAARKSQIKAHNARMMAEALGRADV